MEQSFWNRTDYIDIQYLGLQTHDRYGVDLQLFWSISSMEFQWLVLTSVAFNTTQQRNCVFDGCSWAPSIHSCATIMTILAGFLIVDSFVNIPPCTAIVTSNNNSNNFCLILKLEITCLSDSMEAFPVMRSRSLCCNVVVNIA